MKKIIVLGVIALSVILLSTNVFAGIIQLPKTGQTTCWDSNGNVIHCAGTGQDGDIQAGVAWPDPRFTPNADTSITDNLTGLIWAPDGNLMQSRDPGFDTDGTAGDGRVTWYHAMGYVAKLNNENYLGHSDWCLPNVNELRSLRNAEEANSATWLYSQGFADVQTDNYWASTAVAENPDNAFVIALNDSDRWGGYKTAYYGHYFYAWPVRAGQSGSVDLTYPANLSKTGQTVSYYSRDDGGLGKGVTWPAPRFTPNADTTITDNLTGLIWVPNGNIMQLRDPGFDNDGTMGDGAVTWYHAMNYVAKLNSENYLEHSDWRLPNVNELRSLIDYSKYNPALPQGHPFTNVRYSNSQHYWASTTYVDIPDSAWIVGMLYGTNDVVGKNFDSIYAWPVRGGNVVPPRKNTTYGLFLGLRDGKILNEFRGDLSAESIYNSFRNLGYRSTMELVKFQQSDGKTKDFVENLINDTKKKLIPGDTFILYIAAHGGSRSDIGPQNETTLTPANELLNIGNDHSWLLQGPLEPKPDLNKIVSDDDLYTYLQGLDNINKWIIIDSCHAGGFWGNNNPNDIGDLEKLPNVALLAASPEDGVAVYLDDGLTFFSHAFAWALSRGENGFLNADSNLNGDVTLEELHTATIYYKDNYMREHEAEIVYEAEAGDPVILSPDLINFEAKKTEDFNDIVAPNDQTVINLSSFTAVPKSGEIFIQWQTATELNNVGFNLFRSESEVGGYIKVNNDLIPARGSATQGTYYEFTDTSVQNRKTYYYKLEDIDLSGKSTMHGPVSATPRLIYGLKH